MRSKNTIGLLAALLLAGASHSALAAEYSKEGRQCYEGEANPCAALSADPEFVKENFAFNLSSGVTMQTAETASAIAVQSAHADGLYKYVGSSEGGAIAKCGDKRADFNTAWKAAEPASATEPCPAATTTP